jgi:methylmalonyl-CoA carboxyltransferase small subunit
LEITVKLRITIDDKTYDVDVEVADDHANLPPAYPVGSAKVAGSAASAQTGLPASTAPSTIANENKVCRSPVSGIVVRVLAEAGQQIQAGDSLLVLEAMKMETNITAPAAGVIAAIKVKAGEHVQTGDVLLEFA